MILADKDFFGDVTVFFFAMLSPKLELVYWDKSSSPRGIFHYFSVYGLRRMTGPRKRNYNGSRFHVFLFHDLISALELQWSAGRSLSFSLSWRIGGFLSHRGTPSHHPFMDGFSLTKTIHFWGVPFTGKRLGFGTTDCVARCWRKISIAVIAIVTWQHRGLLAGWMARDVGHHGLI